MTMPLDILMSPGRSNPNGSRYMSSLVAGIGAAGGRVHHWRPYAPFQTGRIFHVHWAETPLTAGAGRGGAVVDALVQANFWSTIAQVRRSGGALVWTAHNLHPHSAALAASKAWKRHFERFCDSLDGVIYLTDASKAALHAAHPRLRDIPMATAQHMHMRAEMPPVSGRDYRADLGIPADVRVIGAIGRMTPQKGAALLAAEFMRGSGPDDWLLLAGEAGDDLKAEIAACAEASGGRIVTFYEDLSDQQVTDLHRAVDVVAFLSNTHLNSGTVMQALSCNRPVAMFETPTGLELKRLAGEDAVVFVEPGRLFEGLEQVGRVRPERDTPRWSLEAFDPATVAGAHMNAYRSFLDRAQPKPVVEGARP